MSKKSKAEKPLKGKAKEKASKKKKPKPAKVIRDSFTMPEGDYAKIKELKSKYLEDGIHIKKGELLRAGLHSLEQMNKEQLLAILSKIERVKTGRPKQ